MSKADDINKSIYNISECHIDFGKGESQSALSRKIEMKELEELMTYEYKSKKNNKNLLEKCDKLIKNSYKNVEGAENSE